VDLEAREGEKPSDHAPMISTLERVWGMELALD
jgi:hypothetical protein